MTFVVCYLNLLDIPRENSHESKVSDFCLIANFLPISAVTPCGNTCPIPPINSSGERQMNPCRPPVTSSKKKNSDGARSGESGQSVANDRPFSSNKVRHFEAVRSLGLSALRVSFLSPATWRNGMTAVRTLSWSYSA
jgi:hypothetical protein